MAIIKITPAQQTILEGIAADANNANASGIQVQPSTPFATTIFPIADYATNVPPGSPIESKVLDGTKGAFAPVIRRIGPISGSASNMSPNISFVDPTVLLTMNVTGMEVPRTVQLVANFSAYSTVSDTSMIYYVSVNGVQQNVLKHFFNPALTHFNLSGTWIITIPVGNPVIELVASRDLGTGNLVLDPGDFITLNFIG